eukprot:COSAG04_NODE_516_length_13191_cov_3.382371_6_plen_161_part_00
MSCNDPPAADAAPVQSPKGALKSAAAGALSDARVRRQCGYQRAQPGAGPESTAAEAGPCPGAETAARSAPLLCPLAASSAAAAAEQTARGRDVLHSAHDMPKLDPQPQPEPEGDGALHCATSHCSWSSVDSAKTGGAKDSDYDNTNPDAAFTVENPMFKE